VRNSSLKKSSQVGGKNGKSGAWEKKSPKKEGETGNDQKSKSNQKKKVAITLAN